VYVCGLSVCDMYECVVCMCVCVVYVCVCVYCVCVCLWFDLCAL